MRVVRVAETERDIEDLAVGFLEDRRRRYQQQQQYQQWNSQQWNQQGDQRQGADERGELQPPVEQAGNGRAAGDDRDEGEHALRGGDVGRMFRQSLSTAGAQGRDLRLRLRLEAVPDLDPVPWEYLYDEPSFLSISAWTPVVRYLDLPRPRAPLAVEPPLRVLGMVSSPEDCEPLDVEEERVHARRAAIRDELAAPE